MAQNRGVGFGENPSLIQVGLQANDTTIPCHVQSVTPNEIVCKMDDSIEEKTGFVTATVYCEGVPSDPVIVADRFRPGLIILHILII